MALEDVFRILVLARTIEDVSPPSIAKMRPDIRSNIYSRAELRALLDSVPQCQRNRACSMSAMTFRTLLLLLYGTGMRVGEARVSALLMWR